MSPIQADGRGGGASCCGVAEGSRGSNMGREQGSPPCPQGIQIPTKDEWRAEEEGRQGTSCHSFHCVHLPPAPHPPSHRQPLGSVWLIREGGGGSRSRHSAVWLGPLGPARPGTRSKGLAGQLPRPPLPLSRRHRHPPSRNPFLRG